MNYIRNNHYLSMTHGRVMSYFEQKMDFHDQIKLFPDRIGLTSPNQIMYHRNGKMSHCFKIIWGLIGLQAKR